MILHENRKTKILLREDYELLQSYARRASDEPRHAPAVSERLLSVLEYARTMPLRLLPPHVVTLGSIVEYRDDVIDSNVSILLAPPEQVNFSGPFVPVLSPFGLELLGSNQGERLEWRTALGGWRGATIIRVYRRGGAAPHHRESHLREKMCG